MLKALLSNALIVLSILCHTTLSAQEYNDFVPVSDTFYCPPNPVIIPSNLCQGYEMNQIAYSPETHGGTQVFQTDDDVDGPYNIGFPFNFYCNTYTQFWIGSNGWISFSPGQPTTYTSDTIPNTGGLFPKNCIFGPWRDWHPGIGSGGYTRYQVLGTAPFRRLVVSWSAVPMYSCTTTYGSFQIVIYETTNEIRNHMISVPNCMAWVSGVGTQGVHNITGTLATTIPTRNATNFTAFNESWEWVFPPVQWVWKGDTVAEGNSITISPSTWEPDTCGYLYAYAIVGSNTYGNIDTIIYDSLWITPSCIEPIVDAISPSCTGDSTGSIAITDTSNNNTSASGFWEFILIDMNGDTVYNQTSSTNQTTITNLPAGQYVFWSKPQLGSCEITFDTITLTEPPIKQAFTISVPVGCNGEQTGKGIAVDTNNYTGLNWDGFYSYKWKNSGGTTISNSVNTTVNSDTLSGLFAGTYNVTIDGCYIQTGQVIITQPPSLLADIINPTKTSCPQQESCDASATAIGTGGTPPYYYLWTSGEYTQSAQNLCAGLNFVTISDANGCDTVDQVQILEPDSIITSAFGDTLICITNLAAIAATSIGGTPPFSYIWTEKDTNGPVISLNSTETVEPHVTTRYLVSSTDANGCPGDTASTLISVRPELGLDIPKVDTICPYDTIDISVSGTGGDSIYTYSWSTGVFGSSTTVSPDLPEWFYVTVSDFCGTPEYHDSVYVQVGGYSKIDAHIQLEDDSICVGKNVYLIASGRGGFRGPKEYRYQWSKPGWTGKDVQFDSPLKTTMYVLTITDLCLSPAGIDTAWIYVGHPAYPEIITTPNESCQESTVVFSLDTANALHEYQWVLYDNDSQFESDNDTVYYRYVAPGCYDVDLSIVTDFGCSSTIHKQCAVRIKTAPNALFTNSPAYPSTLDPVLVFNDASDSASYIGWYIDGTYYGSSEVISYEFGDTGLYEVELIAESMDGCLDTIAKTFHHKLVPIFHIPTSFTPNGDGLNDVFKIVGAGIDPNDFEFVVYDRWGREVFFTKNPDFGWDGKNFANGQTVNSGAFVYVLKYKDQYGEKKQLTGNIIVSITGEPRSLH
ncbi:MAG: gliding motility-associated C-terminal domain-containing protein [Flavobacteriales bacterium]